MKALAIETFGFEYPIILRGSILTENKKEDFYYEINPPYGDKLDARKLQERGLDEQEIRYGFQSSKSAAMSLANKMKEALEPKERFLVFSTNAEAFSHLLKLLSLVNKYLPSKRVKYAKTDKNSLNGLFKCFKSSQRIETLEDIEAFILEPRIEISDIDFSQAFWFDTETTGLDPRKHDIIQIAGISEEEVFEYKAKPLNWRDISDSALKIHGFSREDLESFPEPRETFRKVDQRVKLKSVPAGMNVQFDIDFLASSCSKLGLDTQRKFLPEKLEVQTAVAVYELLKNENLSEKYGLDQIMAALNFEKRHNLEELRSTHSAKTDILLTREVFQHLIFEISVIVD